MLAFILTIASLLSQEKRMDYDGSIQELVIKGNFEVLLFQSDCEDLYIHAPANVSRNIRSEFKDGVYSISNSNFAGTPAKIYLVVKDLKSLKATGNVNIKTPTNIYTKHLELQISDEASATLFISSDDLTLNVKGSGDVNVSGEIDTLRLRAEESANLSFDIKCHKVYSTLKNESEVIFEGSLFYLYAEVFQYAILDNLSTVTGTCVISTYDKGFAKVKAEDMLYLHAGDRSTIAYRGNGSLQVGEKDKKASLRCESRQKSFVVKK